MSKSPIPQHLEDKIKAAFLKHDIVIRKFDAIPHNPFYRPLAKLVTEPDSKFGTEIWCLANRLKDGSFVITARSYDGKIRDAIVLNIDNPDEGLTEEQIRELKEANTNDYKRMDSQALEEGRTRFAALLKLPKADTCEILMKKLIEIPKTSSSFVAKKIDVNGKVYENTLVVPYYIGKDERPTGVQVRLNGGGTRTLRGSKFTGAHHIVQEGKTLFGLGIKVVFLSESYTTGVTIANARPDDMVVCCVGLGQLESVYKALSAALGEDGIIIPVLDKTKNGKFCPKQADVEGMFNEEGVEYIQLPVDDESLSEMTDFNDYLIARGPVKLNSLLDKQLMGIYPDKPEVVGEDELNFQYIMPWSSEASPEKKTKVMNSSIVPRSYIEAFCRIKNFVRPGSGMKPEEKKAKYQQGVIKAFTKEARDKNRPMPRGVGIYRDNGRFVANLKTGRYIINGGIKHTHLSKPLSAEFYMNVLTGEAQDLEKVKFTQGTIDSLRKAWCAVYDSSKELFEPMLGLCVQACYAAFSKHRTHAWITGSSGTGKSAIIKNFIVPAFDAVVMRTNDATAAGVDTKVNAMGIMTSSPFIVLDEQRANSPRRRERVKELIMISRDAANIDEGAAAWRSNADQQSKAYARRFSALFCSTQSILNDKQDISRFLLFHLEDEGVGGRMREIDTLRNTSASRSAELIKGVMQGAEHYEEMEQEVRLALSKGIRGQESRLSHKPSALAPVLAGIGVLEYVIQKDRSIKEIAEAVVARQKEFIADQYVQQDEQFDASSTVHRAITRTTVTLDGLTIPFKKYLDDMSEEAANDFFNNWAMKIGKGKGSGTLYIPVNSVSTASEFFRSSAVRDKFSFDKDDLDDLTRQKNGTSTKANLVINGTSVWCYKIKLGRDNE